MPERGNTGFAKHQELISRMKDADPKHTSGWDELGDFAEFLSRHGKISKTARYPINESLITPGETIYTHKYFDFDRGGHTVTVGGVATQLTKMNYDLLSYLVSKKNHFVGRTELIEKVWENYGQERTVNVHICKLRKILAAGRKNLPEIIKSQKGVGYMLYDELADPAAA
ncbi:MAG: winged helix-turn-helix domain-containing protein [Patescibacteria group bacterium]